MRFDAYIASVPEISAENAVAGVLNALATTTGDAYQRELSRSKRQYENAEAVVCAPTKRTEAIVRWGGNRGAPVLVDSTGPAADPVSAWLRSAWPDHRPTRLDVCCDFDEGNPDLFEQIFNHACELGKAVVPVPIHPMVSGKWHGGYDGRTAYFGSNQSVSQLVIYEKGKQLLGQGHDASPTMVRLEVRCRPPKQHRKLFASLSERDVFNVSPLGPHVRARLDGSVPERTALGSKPPTTLERTATALIRQYGPFLNEFVNTRHAGAWGSAWSELLDIFEEIEGRKARRKIEAA